MILKTKTIRYIPFEVKGGFEIHKTQQPQRQLGFATFRTIKSAYHAGLRWYGGKFMPKDQVGWVNRYPR